MNFKKLFFTIITSLILIAAVFITAVFLRYRAWSADPRPAQKLASYFSRITKSEFQYQSLDWRLAPWPTAYFSKPVFHFKSNLKQKLEADSLQLKLDLFKLILGEVGFSGLRLRGGKWHGQLDAPKGVHDFLIENIDLKSDAIVSDRPVKIYMTGDSGGRHKAVVIHGELRLPPLEEARLDNMGFEVQVLTRNFKFEDRPEWEFLGWIPSSGLSDFLIELRRDPTSDRILFSGDAGLHDLVFRSADRPKAPQHKVGNLQLNYEGYFSPSTDELKFSRCSAELPFSQFNLQGTYLPHRREFRSLTFSLANLKLDDLTKYFPDFKKRMPDFLGVSGVADLSIALNGFLNRLKIYGDFDLTHTLFTYGRFFQKPKDQSFRVKTDFEWAGEMLAGEFSGNFKDLNFKGDLPVWRPSGETKINFITNAFNAGQLSDYVSFLSEYDLGGNMKVFASFEGRFGQPEPFKKMFHLNFADGRILRKGTGAGFKDLNLDIDFGALLTEAKQIRFSLGGSVFKASLKGLHPNQNPVWEGRITSEKMISSDVWKEWSTFWGGAATEQLKNLPGWLQKMVLSSEPFEALSVDFGADQGVSRIHHMEAHVMGGTLTGSGVFQRVNTADVKADIKTSGKNMDANRFFYFLGGNKDAVEGKIDWDAEAVNALNGQGGMNWSGPFSLSIDEAVLRKFDYVQALEQMNTFKEATATSANPVAFQKLSVEGHFENDQFVAESLQLSNSRMRISGAGEMNSDGALSFRLETLLEAGYFRQLFPKRADEFLTGGEPFFGPVTLLASGDVNELMLKPDPQSIASFAGRLARKKTEALSRYL